jgi:hypothetical protein
VFVMFQGMALLSFLVLLPYVRTRPTGAIATG